MAFSRRKHSRSGRIFDVCIIHMMRVLFTRHTLNLLVFSGDKEVRVAQKGNPASSQLNSEEADSPLFQSAGPVKFTFHTFSQKE